MLYINLQVKQSSIYSYNLILSYVKEVFKHIECMDCKCNVSEFPYI